MPIQTQFPITFNSRTSSQWAAVAAPDTWAWEPPFTVQQQGSTFRVDPDFDLEAYANITIAKTYYVTPDGNNGNSGADEANALASVSTALNKADVDRVLVKAGTYVGSNGWNNASPARSIKVMGYGGNVILSTHVEGLSWSAVDSHYEASYATNIGTVVDFLALDDGGDGIPLVAAANAAAVDSTPGTWYYDATLDIIYVNTSDSRAPDANIRCYISTTNGRMNDAVTYYVEGIEFHGGTSAFLAGIADAGAKLYFKNCAFKYTANTAASDGMLISGLGEVICHNCVATRNGGDGFKVQLSGAVVANAALIDCIGRHNGRPGITNANGSSRHGPGNTIGINCEFHDNYGPGLFDVTNDTQSWYLGCYSHDPASASSRFGFAVQNIATLWLDGCESSGNADGDLYCDTGATISYRNMTPATPTTSGGGTIQTY